MTYQLELTEDDIDTIAFIGGRYSWPSSLMHLASGLNEIEEHEAWEILEAFEDEDFTFPMLDPHSELAEKLLAFWQSVV